MLLGLTGNTGLLFMSSLMRKRLVFSTARFDCSGMGGPDCLICVCWGSFARLRLCKGSVTDASTDRQTRKSQQNCRTSWAHQKLQYHCKSIDSWINKTMCIPCIQSIYTKETNHLRSLLGSRSLCFPIACPQYSSGCCMQLAEGE